MYGYRAPLFPLSHWSDGCQPVRALQVTQSRLDDTHTAAPVISLLQPGSPGAMAALTNSDSMLALDAAWTNVVSTPEKVLYAALKDVYGLLVTFPF